MSLQSLFPVLSFIAGVAVTAIVGAVVSRIWERARPSAWISDILLGPTEESGDRTVDIPIALRGRIERNLITPNLEPGITTNALRDYIERSRAATVDAQDIIRHLRSMLDRPNLLDPALDKDEQRRELLREWSRYGNQLEALAQTAIGYYLKDVLPVYREACPEEWRDPKRAVIRLSEAESIALFEIDIDKVYDQAIKDGRGQQQAESERSEADIRNIRTRFWIRLEPDHLRWLLAKTATVADSFSSDANTVLGELDKLVDLNAPEYLRVQSLVCNDGRRAVAIKPCAYLRMPLGDPKTDRVAFIPLTVETPLKSRTSAIVLKGDDATHIAMRSEQPIASLKVMVEADDILDGPRLRNLYEGRVLNCQLGLSLTGFAAAWNPLVISTPYSFGASADKQTRVDLLNALARAQ
jgi:hypothetical protein